MQLFRVTLLGKIVVVHLAFLAVFLPLISHAQEDSLCGFITIGSDEDATTYMLQDDGTILEDETEAVLQAVPPESSLKGKFNGVTYTLSEGNEEGKLSIKAKKSSVTAKKTIRNTVVGFFVNNDIDKGLFIVKDNDKVYKASFKKSGKSQSVVLKSVGDFEETECFADDTPPDEGEDDSPPIDEQPDV